MTKSRNKTPLANTAEVDENPTAEECEMSEVAPDWSARLQEAQDQTAEYLDGWQRARAELANYKRRTEAEREEQTRRANSALVYQLLPVLDDLDRAEATLPADLRNQQWVDGVLLIARKLRTILEAAGLEPLQAVGQPFDPNFHHAVMYAPVDDPALDEHVVEDLQKGYLFGGQVLRPTMVKIGQAE
ncbi:MAG: nucleotide exchange factor GrpE [Chloroflexi bacterium]|nr:nucleotide exchange factor GrpE [Chloroflexota bacterium]MBU1748025.1 nucleotide exchange factor GrpE [Chloroflexota bacterium]MBU1877360.1 nucleotide exchange factor GrpE [Chloroflexota bacterium]